MWTPTQGPVQALAAQAQTLPVQAQTLPVQAQTLLQTFALTQMRALPPTRERALSLTQDPTLAPTQNFPQAQVRRVAQHKRHHGTRGLARTRAKPRMLLQPF